MSTVSVIVVTHNSADTVTACLRSVAAAFHPTNNHASQGTQVTLYEILIVDTESSDETIPIVRAEARTLPITLLRVPNRGFGSAANVGAAQAIGDVLWFLNPDAVVPPRCSERLLQFFSTPRVVAVTGVLTRTAEGTTEVYGEPFPSLGWYVRRRFPGQCPLPPIPHSLPPRPISVPWLSAASLLARADAFRAIGGFSEKYFLYYEDVDFSRRLRAAGGALLIDPAVRIQHAGGQSTKKRDRLRASDRAEDRYFKIHRPILERILLWFIRPLRRAWWTALLPGALLGGMLFGTPAFLAPAAALVGVLAVMAVIVRVPDLGAMLLLLSLVAGQSIRLPLGTTTVTLTDLLLPLVVGAWLVRAAHGSRPRVQRMALRILLLPPLALLPGLLLATERLPVPDWVNAAAYAARLLLLVLLVPLGAQVLQRPQRIPLVLIGVTAVLSLLGVVQWRAFPSTTEFQSAIATWLPLRAVSAQGWDPHMGRLFSTWLDPNLLGGMLVLGVAVLQALPLPKSLVARLAALFGSVVILTALILTKSRTSLMAFLVLLTASVLVARPWRRLSLLITGAVLGLVLTPSFLSRVTAVNQLDPTTALRVVSWQQAIAQSLRAPTFGLGYNTYGAEQLAVGNIQTAQLHSWAGADSSPLTLLATTGVWGVLLLGALVLGVLWVLFRRGRCVLGRSAATAWTARAAFLGLVGLFAHSQFVQSLLSVQLAVPLVLLLAAAFAERASPHTKKALAPST